MTSNISMAVLTGACDEEDQAALSAGLPRLKEWCERHNYALHVSDEACDLQGRDPSWLRVDYAQQLLPSLQGQHTHLLWLDPKMLCVHLDHGVEGLLLPTTELYVESKTRFSQGSANAFILKIGDNRHLQLDDWRREGQSTSAPMTAHAALNRLIARKKSQWGTALQTHCPAKQRKLFELYRRSTLTGIFSSFAGRLNRPKAQLMENLGFYLELPSTHRITSRAGFPHWLNARGLTGTAAEIGVLRGAGALSFLEAWQGQKLILVDPWKPVTPDDGYSYGTPRQHQDNFQAARDRLKAHEERVSFMKNTSVPAASHVRLESLDFAYIDADHGYNAVTNDLAAWWPKIKPGGLLAGNCFIDCHEVTPLRASQIPGYGAPHGRVQVRRAVLRFAAKHKLQVGATIFEQWPSWYIFKPGNER